LPDPAQPFIDLPFADPHCGGPCVSVPTAGSASPRLFSSRSQTGSVSAKRIVRDRIAGRRSNQPVDRILSRPDCWTVVAKALDGLGVRHPVDFTDKVLFPRRCGCSERNVVRDNDLT
jgi:hypothetical protein